ncbi:MAG: endonuclease domain-containing protein, partial [Myxococcaceae bacterium]|nr:endonuclease domain-containing protein [Myxococcaceae bacterium]
MATTTDERAGRARVSTEDERGSPWEPTPVPPALLRAARDLRAHLTNAEHALWACIRRKQLRGFRFRRQHPVAQYVLDFYCPAARLAVEVDGGQHGTDGGRARDAARAAFLGGQGIRVLRFWNSDVQANLEGVLVRIWEALREAEGGPPPPTPPGGGG